MPSELSLFALVVLAQIAASARLLRCLRISRLQLDTSVASFFSSEQRDDRIVEGALTSIVSVNEDAYDWEGVLAEYVELPPTELVSAVASGFADWFQSLLSYRFLQRMTAVAPLLGLVVTCWGLFGGRVVLDDIQQSMRPLVYGVGGGAVVALINQCLLFLIQWRAATVQKASQSIVRAQAVGGAPLVGSGGGGRGFAAEALDALRAATEQNQLLVDTIQQLHGRMSDQADRQASASAGLLGTMEVLPDRLAGLADAIRAAETVYTNTTGGFERTAAAFRTEVDGFSRAISSQLVPLVSSQAVHVDQVGVVATAACEALGELREAVGLLKAVATTHETVARSYSEIVGTIVVPSHEQVYEAASRIGKAAASLGGPLEALVESIRSLDVRLEAGGSAIDRLFQGVARFTAGIDGQLMPAIEQYCGVSKNLEKTTAGILGAANTMRDGVSGLEASAKYHGAATDRMLEAIDQKVIPAYQVLAQTALSLEEAVQAFVESADNMRVTTVEQGQAAIHLRGEVEEVVKSFAEAGERLSRYEDAAAEPLAAVTTLIHRTNDLTRQIEPVVRVMQSGVDSLRSAINDSTEARQQLATSLQTSELATKLLVTSAQGIKDASVAAGKIRSDSVEVVMQYLRQLHGEMEEVRRLSAIVATPVEIGDAVADALRPLQKTMEALAASVASEGLTAPARKGWFRR